MIPALLAVLRCLWRPRDFLIYNLRSDYSRTSRQWLLRYTSRTYIQLFQRVLFAYYTRRPPCYITSGSSFNSCGKDRRMNELDHDHHPSVLVIDGLKMIATNA